MRMESLVEHFIPEALGKTIEGRKSATMIVRAAIAATIFAFIYGVIQSIGGHHSAANALYIVTAVCALGPFILRASASTVLTTNVIISTIVTAVTFIVVTTGGSHSMVNVWYGVILMIALLLGGKHTMIVWAILVVADVCVVYWLETQGMGFPMEVDSGWIATYMFSAQPGYIILTVIIALTFYGVNENALRELAAARDEAERSAVHLGHMADELKQLNESLEQQKKDLEKAKVGAEEATRAKSAFLATMSHEIRTPLNGIIGTTGLLLETEMSEDQQEFTNVIRTSGNALLAIINDILDFSKIEAGQVELEEHSFAVHQCIEEAMDLVTVRAVEKKLELVYQIEETVPDMVVGDVLRVRQVLVNLLSNAVKFTEQGAVVVTASARPAEDLPSGDPALMLCFSVRDTGIGIPEDKMDRLFQLFSQVDVSTARQFGGTGLGLAISKELSEAMGGSVSVKSELGHGSTFSFTVRVRPAAQEPGTDMESLAGYRVLIVDDNPDSRQALVLHARRANMHAVAVASGWQAVELITHDESFDLVLLDRALPELDNLQLAGRLHTLRPELPLVVLSSIRTPVGGTTGPFAAQLSRPVKQRHFRRVVRECIAAHVHPTTGQRSQVREKIDARNGRSGKMGLRILVAEDNPVNQRVIDLMLRKMGYRADIVADGTEVLDALERRSYDLILMDIRMPQMDGLETSRRIMNKSGSDPRPRIIALTADVTQHAIEASKAAGMEGFLAKPIEWERLQTLLNDYEREPVISTC